MSIIVGSYTNYQQSLSVIPNVIVYPFFSG